MFNSIGRISNVELVRAAIDEFNKAQAEQDIKYNVVNREIQDIYINRIRDITQKLIKNTIKKPRKLIKDTKKKLRKLL